MTRVNPFSIKDEPLISPLEAILFSDIRLHIALILRERNGHVFRPDLFDEHIQPNSEILSGLGNSVALAKLRFLSTNKLSDDRHLQFMPHLAEAVAWLTNAEVVFDTISEELHTSKSFRAKLESVERADCPEFHLRTGWQRHDSNGLAFTKGLVKVGLPELETPMSSSDHSVLLQAVMEQSALQLWEMRFVPPELKVNCFDDEFHVILQSKKNRPTLARVLRIHES
jgi:hypothetical protein